MTSTRTKRQKLLFERSCKCKNMKLLLQNIMKIPIVYIMSDAKIIPENHNHLVSKGMLTNGCKYVCNNCLKYATDYLPEENGKEVPFTYWS